MVGIDDFSRIVSAIYASAITPENWIVAMAGIRRALDAQSAALLLADGTSRSLKSGSLPPEAQKTYLDYYRQIDYVLDAVEEGPVGLIRSGQPLIALKARSEFDADWMRPHQMDDGLFVRLTNDSMPTCFLVAAPKRSEPFDTAERVKLMSALVPHLQQALRTQGHLKDFAQGASDIARAVDGVRHGIAVVGAGSVVIHIIPPPSESSSAATDCVYVRAALKRLVRLPALSCAAASSQPSSNTKAVLATAIPFFADDRRESVRT